MPRGREVVPGYSGHSHHKHAALGPMIEAAMPVIGTVLQMTPSARGTPPLLFDTHAGPYRWGDGVLGSPHLLATKSPFVERRLVLCEINPERRASLLANLDGCRWDYKVYEDYREVLGRASSWRRSQGGAAPFGLMNIDPTGATDFDHEVIVAALDTAYLQRMDVILHGSETAHARVQGANPDAATWAEKMNAFKRIGFKFATLQFPQDKKQQASSRWRLAFGTRYEGTAYAGEAYIDAVREAALGAGLIEALSLFDDF